MIESKNNITILEINSKIPSIEELHKTIKDISVFEDIEDFSELRKYENLVNLNIDSISSNIALLTLRNSLNELKKFKSLEINIGQEVDFELFGASSNIKNLQIRAKIEDNSYELRALGCDEIDCYINKKFDIKTLNGWDNLKVLGIQFPKVENLEFLQDLKNLEVLQLYDNCFDNIEWLLALKNLKYLYIYKSSNFSDLEISIIEDKLPNITILTEESKKEDKDKYFEFVYGQQFYS